jgi:hypothetical protein
MWVNAEPPADPETEDTPFIDILWGHWSSGLKGETEPGKGAVPVIFFSPDQTTPRPDGPKRTIRYLNAPPGGIAGLDLRGIDAGAEVEAFRRAYRTELAALAEWIGSPPVLRWGVIHEDD